MRFLAERLANAAFIVRNFSGTGEDSLDDSMLAWVQRGTKNRLLWP